MVCGAIGTGESKMDIGRDLVEATIQDLLQVRDGLLGQRSELDDRLYKLNARIKQWQEQLIPKANGDGGEAAAKRRKKGESLEIVEKVFRENPSESGLTIREVSDTSGLPWSSARNVLQKHADKFEERDGQWYRKPIPPKRERLAL
jgi:hypothetical protein